MQAVAFSATPSAGTTDIAVGKEKAIESEPYRRLVAQLPCVGPRRLIDAI